MRLSSLLPNRDDDFPPGVPFKYQCRSFDDAEFPKLRRFCPNWQGGKRRAVATRVHEKLCLVIGMPRITPELTARGANLDAIPQWRKGFGRNTCPRR